MTKTCRQAAVFILILVFRSFCFAADENSKWIIGATEFVYTQDFVQNEYETALLSAVPKLILEQLYGIKTRNVPSSETVRRRLDFLQTERLALFLELSNAQKQKDALVVQNADGYRFKKKTDEMNNKIKEITKKIDVNLSEQESLLRDFSSGASAASKKDGAEEYVSFYKSDPDALFSFSSAVKKIDYAAFDCSSEIAAAKISGLITGSAVIYGEYAAVSAELFLYPGAVSAGVVTEVGSVTEPEKIAKNIAYRLVPKIENAVPCEIQIEIKPEPLRAKTKLTVDSTVYHTVPKTLVLSSGVHRFSFECAGYKRESFSYGLGYEKKYLMEISLSPEERSETALVLKNPLAGNLFYNGQRAEDNRMPVKMNGADILGYYYTESGNTLFFTVPERALADGKAVSASLKDYDVGADIEKKRKMMYISYSALICSLPFLFYSYSNYSTLYNGYASGTANINVSDIEKYRTMSYAGIALSVGCGIWFVTQLVIYLTGANKALPVEAKRSNIDFNTALEQFKVQQQEYNENSGGLEEEN